MPVKNKMKTGVGLKSRLKAAIRVKKVYSDALSDSNKRFGEKVQELSILRRISDSISSSLDEKTVCESIVHILISELTAENCSVMLTSENGRYLILKAAQSPQDPKPGYFSDTAANKLIKIKIGEGVAGWVAKTRKPQLIKDISKNKRFKIFEGGLKNINSLLCVPIVGKEGLIGVLNLSHPEIGEFSKENERLLTLIVGQAALAFDNIRLFKRIKKRTRELEETQKELIQAGKLAALGEIASGIAHEINNPVSIIRGYAEELKYQIDNKTPPDKSTLLNYLDIIIKSSDRCYKITTDILDFSKPQPKNLELLPLNEIISASIEMVQPYLNSNGLKIEVNGKGVGGKIKTDKNYLEQVFINMLSNAIDASEKGATIKISTRQLKNNIEIDVTNRGIGIPKRDLQKIFDPFYSTKKKGKGTGLGLSICYRIIKMLDGNIKAASGRGKTTFTITLPIKK